MKPAAWARRLPWSMVAAAVLLVGLGWLGIARVEELTEGSGRFLQRQVAYSAIALVVMLLVTIPNYRTLCRFSYGLFLLAIVLLVVVYRCPPINGAHRWIRMGPVGLQPSELAKVAFVLALARYLMYRDNYRRLLRAAGPAGADPAAGAADPQGARPGNVAGVSAGVLRDAFCRRGATRRPGLRGAGGLLVLPLLWTQMSPDQKSRITALFDQPPPDRRPSEDAYQLHQAKQMRALGGVWGSLLAGQPTDDLAAYRLPEARSDFIFCVLGERLGLPGMALVLALFALLVWRGLAIAAETREPFGRLLATGVATLCGRRGADQHRHDRGPVARHRAFAAAGELRRLGAAGPRGGDRAAAERRPAARL